MMKGCKNYKAISDLPLFRASRVGPQMRALRGEFRNHGVKRVCRALLGHETRRANPKALNPK